MKTTFTLYCSEYRQNQYNKTYAIQKKIRSCEDLKQAVAFDHTCTQFRDFERKNDKFLQADCAMFDVDNTESDNSQDWVTVKDVQNAFPQVPFYVSYSRNHMKQKGGKSPRPKFHVYFPHQVITSKEKYQHLKEQICAYFPAFDANAKDVSRFFFGVEQPKVEYVEGTLSLVDFMNSVKSKNFTDSTSSHTRKEVIPEGERNTTMSRYAAKVLKRWGNCDKAYQLFIKKSKQCVPPLVEQELHTIWKSAVGFFHERVEQDPNYVSPEQFHSQKAGQKYCLEVKDFLAWGNVKELQRTSRKLSVEAIQLLLQAFSVQVRINDMSKIVEVSGLPKQYQNEDAFASLTTILFDTATKLGFTYVQQNNVYNFLSLLANEKRYHPVMNLLASTEWDQEDRFPELYRMMGISDSFDKTLVHKWALQTIAVLYNTQKSPIAAQGMLVLQGGQGIGKTELFRHLAIEDSFFKGGATLDMSNKDSVMSATKVWICEVGETDATTEKKQGTLKSFLTEVTDRYREPYARTESVRSRHTSFCGTVNPKMYLNDPTGNRRFWTIHVEKMDLDAIFSYSKAWYTQFWKQVQEEYMENPKGYLLTPQEQEEVIRNNSEYETPLYGEDELLTVFDLTADFSQWKKWTASELASFLNFNFKGLIDEKWAQGSEIYYTDNNTLIIQNPVPGYTYELAPSWLYDLSGIESPYCLIVSQSFKNGVVYSERRGVVKIGNPNNTSLSTKDNLQVGDTVVFEAVPDEGYHVRSFSVINNKYETLDLEIKELGDNKYSFVQPDDVVIIGVDFSKNNSTPEEPGDEPVEDTPSEDVPSDNNQTIVENLPNGYTSTKIVAPQGDVLLTITNSAGDSLANIYIPSVLGDAKDFVDNRSGWFKEAVDKASALGLFAGTSDSEFSPNMPMTRAMLVTVLHNLSSKPYYGNSYFNDVPSGSWYESAVDWAWTLGITAGTGSGFSPSDNITREQLVTMLYHYAELIGVNSDNRASLSGFSDSGDVSSYAYDAMRWAVAEGFVNGMGDGTLAPKGNATRAQVASILTKFVESIAGRDVTDPPAVPLSTQNGYCICPICKFVNEEGTPCIACSTINQAKPEEYCPTCGGGYDVGGVVPWVYCYYCKDYFSGPEGPYYNCRRCGKSGLRPSDLDPESELCADCFDPNPQYCTECGRSSNVVIITRYGYCEDCYQKNHAGEFGYCEVCGIPLSAAQSVMYNGKRCFSCCVCKYCGTYIMEEEYDRHGEFICDACSKLPRVYCAECGADITGQQSFNGLCSKCWITHPNVYCPNCGYGFFTTGVGNEGFFCPECGYNWLPGLQ